MDGFVRVMGRTIESVELEGFDGRGVNNVVTGASWNDDHTPLAYNVINAVDDRLAGARFETEKLIDVVDFGTNLLQRT